MAIIVIGIILSAVLTVMACCMVASECTREEEQEDG